ncbi:MAG: hypothetical protein ABWZ15_08900 [Acidimicrobiia bacterium]
MNGRALMRIDALGCAIATDLAIAREGLLVAAVFAATVAVALTWSFASDSLVATGMSVLAFGNVAWGAAVVLALAAGLAEGADAWLLAATIPYTLVLAFMQWRSLRTDLRTGALVS